MCKEVNPGYCIQHGWKTEAENGNWEIAQENECLKTYINALFESS